uniref:Uncharacterized protein n=1 Tax=Meloidogyne floridensis TaxID=298350 RepID=A0A915NKF3_9BILA
MQPPQESRHFDVFPTKRNHNPLFSSVYKYFDKCRDSEGRKENKEISEKIFEKILKLRNKLGDNYTLNTEWIKETHPIDEIKPIRYPIFFIGKDKEIHGKINSVNHYRIFLAFNIDEDEGINTVNLKKILQEFIKRNNLNNNVEEWVENHAKIIKFTKEINEECAEEIKSKSPKFVLKTLNEINKITETINWEEILHFGQIQKMLVPDCPETLKKLNGTIINEKEIMQDYLELTLIRKYTAALMGNYG